jgi:drug/metabolite transporter (DMT)-like permease
VTTTEAAAALALASAACLALGLVVTSIGLRARPVVAAAATSVPTAAALMWLASPLLWRAGALRLDGFDPGAAAVFAACGAVFPVGVTLLTFAANRRMGPALTGAIGGTAPLFAAGLAALLLGEALTPVALAGTVVVAAGVGLLSLRGAGRAGAWPLAALALPLAAAALRGAVQPMIRHALAAWPSPFAAALIGYSVSSVVVLALHAARPAPAPTPRERWAFMLVGVCNAVAVLLMYAALARGPVARVAPLVATYPLFTLGFAALLLRGEAPGGRVIAGIGLTVGGVILVLSG